ncbi:nitroreductase [Cocleimonas sp. KMM 6892]|uniref:nitroreductase n=1 Tax=unclassified Cocleimonas TaxID=2639732 RepID=UPI002DBA0B37|nr:MULTISPECIES: nitroreductase [unclassified Cocleimonas]MEB8434268.1 nitroreductase [Cocleimonas sp. KMM 6892]MEC4717113.1 nitroreductase [Cocleimonas sp. KMM 6895]MEC4746540.1 nitroreductase [Cocleimonas sp. KMM 6896]
MNVSDALKQRKSVRAYMDKPVEDEKIQAVLEAARYSPSGTNTQPWQVAVVTGNSKLSLQDKIETAFRGGDRGKADYDYYPTEWVSPFKDRRKECGLLMYSTLGITREDTDRQMDQWAANYRSFDAPVMLLFFMDKIMERGSFMDYGMFLQSIMLAAEEQGLATCPQASLADYPHIIKPELGYDDNTVLLCGIALGYEEKGALVNSYRTSRLEVEEFTQFFK